MKISEEAQYITRHLEGEDTAHILLKNLCPAPKARSANEEQPVADIQMFTQLRKKLPTIVQRIDVDLITLNEMSTKLLTEFSEQLKTMLNIEIKSYDQAAAYPPIFVAMVMDTLSEAATSVDKCAKGRQDIPRKEKYGSRLPLAAEVMKKTIPVFNLDKNIEPFPAIPHDLRAD